MAPEQCRRHLASPISHQVVVACVGQLHVHVPCLRGIGPNRTTDDDSQAERPSEHPVECVQIVRGQGTQLAPDHRPLDRPDDAGHARREQEPGLLPISDDVIADQTAPRVARDGGDYDFFAGSMVERGTDDKSGAKFCCRLIREGKLHQDYVTSVIAGHTPHLLGCPTAPQVRDQPRLSPRWRPAHPRSPGAGDP